MHVAGVLERIGALKSLAMSRFEPRPVLSIRQPRTTYVVTLYVQVPALKKQSVDLCAELGPQAVSLCDAFAITDTMLSAPIALDWVQVLPHRFRVSCQEL